MPLPLREDLAKTFLFRKVIRTVLGYAMSTERLPYGTAAYWIKAIGILIVALRAGVREASQRGGERGRRLDTWHGALGTVHPGICDLMQCASVCAGMCLCRDDLSL